MRWLLVKSIEGVNRRFVKYKCGRCGTTHEVGLESSHEPWPLPRGWAPSEREGWFICQSCESPKAPKKKPLQVIYG